MSESRRTINLPSATISYLEWGSAAGGTPSVVLLHGGGADSAELSWGEVGSALARAGFRVIAPDHPGFGCSPRAEWALTQKRLERYVGQLIDVLGLDGYVIGGLSLGGGLTLGHLLDRRESARGAMLLGSFAIMPRLSDGPLSAVSQLGTWLLLRSGILDAMTRSYSRNAGAMERGLRQIVRSPEARTPELVREVIAEAARGDSLAAFGEWQRDQVGWRGLRTDYTDRLHAISTPTLIVHGDRDGGVPIARARQAARLLPRSELVEVAGAGHWVQRDRPDIVIDAMLRFLEGLR